MKPSQRSAAKKNPREPQKSKDAKTPARVKSPAVERWEGEGGAVSKPSAPVEPGKPVSLSSAKPIPEKRTDPSAALPCIYLIRHGETEWSRSGQHTGRTDVPLNAIGEAKAQELGQSLRHIEFARVLSSPRQRAHRTCQLAGFGTHAEIDSDLAEWDYGDYEGKRSVEIRQMRPDWILFRDGCPNGESLAQVSARADRCLARLRSFSGNIAVFCHGHFGRVLAARWIGLPASAGQHFLLGTASYGILDFEHQQIGEPAIARWNIST